MKKILSAIVMLGGIVGQTWALSVTPSLQAFDIRPGGKIEGEVVVLNSEEETVSITPVAKNWFQLPANKNIKIEDWLKIKSEVFSLNPGESKKLKFVASAPKKAQGELVGMLSFKTITANREGIEFVMSVPVYVSVTGSEKLEGNIRAFMVSPSSEAVQAGVLIENTGNVHLRPQGMLEIYDADNNLIANVEIPKGHPTYPGGKRPYMGVVKGLVMTPGKYTAQIQLHDMDRNVPITKKKQKFSIDNDLKMKL